ncbi:MAG TPA: oligopeptide/dipeptide ABC transporter ATP-binding protein [Actinocrinis sp.]
MSTDTTTSAQAGTEDAAAPVLEVNDLTVDYRRRGAGPLRAVDHLSFRLEPGRTLALVGESGSGKSTVVRALAGFVAPTEGTVALEGVRGGRGRRADREYRKALQLVFQDPFASLNPMHTVARHLRRPVVRYQAPGSRAQAHEAVLELLRSVNLTPEADIAGKYPHELSGGQRQRVAIARALATGPRVLLADEPVSMLDVSIRLEILNLLDRLARERDMAMLYVTHDLATARHFSSQIMVMYRGEVVEDGPSDEVILNPAHPYTRMLAAAAPDPTIPRERAAAARRERIEARGARVAEYREADTGAGCRFRSRCPHAMPVCGQHPPDFAAGPGHTARCWLFENGSAGVRDVP